MAVSVRTPPKAPRWTERAGLEEMKEEAGRERREKERANTMLNVNEWNEVFQLSVEFELALQWVRQCKEADLPGGDKCGIEEFFLSDVKNLGIGNYHSPTYGNYN